MSKKKSRLEKALERLSEDQLIPFKRKDWTPADLIQHLLKENRKLKKSQCVVGFDCYHKYDDFIEDWEERVIVYGIKDCEDEYL